MVPTSILPTQGSDLCTLKHCCMVNLLVLHVCTSSREWTGRLQPGRPQECGPTTAHVSLPPPLLIWASEGGGHLRNGERSPRCNGSMSTQVLGRPSKDSENVACRFPVLALTVLRLHILLSIWLHLAAGNGFCRYRKSKVCSTTALTAHKDL